MDTTLNHDCNQSEDYSSLCILSTYSSTEFNETFQVGAYVHSTDLKHGIDFYTRLLDR